MTVLVSGAGGKTGRAVIGALRVKGEAVRAFSRRPLNLAGVEDFVGDLQREDDWRRAIEGIEKIYHICPNMHPQEERIGQRALAAAVEAGVDHFAYHSVLHPQTESMPHHWHKLRVEEALLRSGLPFTILRPAAYMQNIRSQWETIRTTGIMTMPYPVTTRLSLVDLTDVAAVAAVVLGDRRGRFTCGTFELSGTPPLSQQAVAGLLSGPAGRPVTAREQPLAAWEAEAAGLPPYTRDLLLRMFRYYAAYGLAGNPFTLSAILDRAPTTLETCAAGWL